MKNKITKLIIGFLLLFPFRLPISILMIQFFNWIIGLTEEKIPHDVLATNVIVTKIVYNLAVSCWFLYAMETYSREIKGRQASDGSTKMVCYWWVLLTSVALLTFIVIDAVTTYQIFYK